MAHDSSAQQISRAILAVCLAQRLTHWQLMLLYPVRTTVVPMLCCSWRARQQLLLVLQLAGRGCSRLLMQRLAAS
jgi:hypothetical protein